MVLYYVPPTWYFLWNFMYLVIFAIIGGLYVLGFPVLGGSLYIPFRFPLS